VRAAPGTGFATPAPTGAQIHSGITAGCDTCHEANQVWMGVSAYPISPSVLTTGASYRGFQTRPRSLAGTYNVADAAHPGSGDCAACHLSTTAFTGVVLPANHIPFAANTACNACHTGGNYAVMPSLANIHANAPSTTGNCAQCHGSAAASFAIPASNFNVVGLPSNHIPTSLSCEVCHVGAGSSVATLPVPDGAKFSGSLMSHAGISSNCVACHVPSGTPAAFAGIARLVGMPATSPASTGSHIPSSTTCENCHLGSTPAGMVAASATKTAPGTAFSLPAPTGAMIHSGVTGGCNACHDAGLVWMGVSAYPISPSTLTAGAQYYGFQTRPRTAAGTYNVADPAHPLSGDCSQCHSSTTAFSGIDKPANHIPYSATAQCNSCHTTTDYAVMPTLASIHANAPSTTSNCAQCHGAAAASFAIPAASFSIVGLPSNHLPTTASCEVCHVGASSSIAALPVGNGARFSGSQMSHAGIASNCVACHVPSGTSSAFAGIARVVGMPPTSPAGASSHIPSSTTCETCHLASTPAGLIAATATATAPGTGFANPAPTGTQIHSGVSSGCASCHESSMVWMGMGAYPISPSTLVAGAQYKGFQTRPRAAASTFSVADTAHPAAGECSQCHVSTTAFTGIEKPANHIPVASTAQCTHCHTSSDYAVSPTLADIHAWAPSTTTNCAQCHGATAASFAIPSANFAIVGLPSNHIPTSASCEVCHVAAGSSVVSLPVGNGARFSGSLMSHAGITSNCVSCHVPAGTSAAFAGIARVVGMPATSPAGAASHIPSSTTCETCHLASTPAGFVAASATVTAPGTAFATPAPTSSQIHGSMTSGCNTCHEAGLVWMGVSAYPIAPSVVSPGAQFHGFQTRPTAAGSTYSVADVQHPSGRDCSECHSGTAYFIGPDKPANHIPYATTAVCDSCHTSTDYAVMPTLANIHANAPSTTTNCSQCHGAAAASFALPAHNFTIVGLPSNHLPTTASCEVCHVGPGSSITALPVANGARFAASQMNHAGITTNCVSCHVPAGSSAAFAGITRIVGMPPTSPVGSGSHIPSSTVCESCHLATTPVGYIAASATRTAPGTAFATPAPTGVMIHNGVTSGCNACHDSGAVWMGVGAYPITPTTVTTGAQYKGFQTRPRSAAGTYNVADTAHPLTGDCSQCHGSTTAFSGVDVPANHIPFAATARCNSCHTSTDYAVMPTLANIHANAQSTTTNCAQCHGATAASFAIPAANFAIVGLPSNHIPTSESCEVCHVGTGSSIAVTPVGNGARFSGSLMSHLRITTNCVACHRPAANATTFAGITAIVGMPATSPAGANAHIPSSTVCEACHLATTPTTMVAASAIRTAPGTAFASPAPTGVQIHAGISSGCNACHDTNLVWMGMNAYPINPSTLTSGAQYKGFQTRPVAGASTFRVADAGHPVTGECSLCHTSTTAFTGVNVPSNHIPYATAASCIACHTDPNYAVMPTLANIHANAQSTTTNCAQCHSAAAVLQYAIPAANFSIVGIPTNGTHIPTTASCEVCHVGTGSSVVTLPVGNSARFSGSRMSHAGITTNCVACHVTSGTVAAPYTGITRIVGMPVTSPMGVGAHIPSNTVCENCHATSSVPGLIAASATLTAPGTLFATPVPTGVQIHTGITSGCNACHDTNMVWMGMGSYPITPNSLQSGAQYKGFQTRPRAAAGTYNVVDSGHPATGDCSTCHNGTTYFDGAVKPTGHIPTNGSCSTCHVVAGNFTISGLGTHAQLHTGITSGCRTCHAAGPFAGSGPTSSTLCTTAALPYQPVPMPLSSCGASPTVSSPLTHIPVGSAACEICHGSINFTNFKMSTTKAMRPTTTTGPVPGTTMHTVGVPNPPYTCMSCHERGYTWFGVSIVTRDGANHHAGQDCNGSGCHRNTSKSFAALIRPVPVRRAAVNGALPRLLPRDLPGVVDAGLNGGAKATFDHRGVSVGQCQTCHNGQLARGRPAKHFGGRLSCDSCHRTTAWAPAQFSHAAGAAGQCMACHNGVDAGAKPGQHFVTSRSCDSCHQMLAWAPVRYQHLSPAYQPSPDRSTCIACHVTNGEIIPHQARGGARPRPVPAPAKSTP
jgi:alkylated DNA nucleotide flippase Atl1